MNAVQCDNCEEGFSLAKEGCVVQKECTAAQYFDPNKQLCTACAANCLKCFWDDMVKFARCAWCADTYKLVADLTCKVKLLATDSRCPSAFYEDTTNQVCMKCQDKCTNCKFDTALNTLICGQCQFGYTVDIKGGCVLKTTTTTTSSSSNTDTGSTTNTTTTGTGSTTPAVPEVTCMSGFFKNEAGTGCLSCPKECTECQFNPDTKSVFCFACLNEYDYFLNSRGTCLKTLCASGMIFNPMSTTGCDKCPDKCNSCERTATGSLGCLVCVTGFKPDSAGVCAFDGASCPAKTTSVGTYCKACPEPCSKCEFVAETKSIICTECVTGFVPDAEKV